MTIKAYAVLQKYEMTGEIYFASKAIQAAVAGANELADGELGGVQCRRAKWADGFAETGVPAWLAIDHGWRFECSGCGVTLDSDIEATRGLPLRGVCGTVSSAVYCCGRCKWRSTVRETRRIAEEAAAIDDFKRIVMARFPDADFADDETHYRTHHAHVVRSKGTGHWHRRQVVVSFRFPGMEFASACFRIDGYDRIGPPHGRYTVFNADREAFEAYARQTDERRKRMLS
jgi:hypothetical protein